MQRDHYLSISQFMDDPSFREWVLTGRDTAGWAQWTEASPENLHLAEEAKSFLLAMGKPEAAGNLSAIDQALAESWRRIREYPMEQQGRMRRLSPWWKAAAAVIFLGGALAWYASATKTSLSHNTSLSALEAKQVEMYNDTETTKLITLDDGSSVLLQPHGKLTYPEFFDGGERCVHLSGEAFFEISKDPDHPFLVYTNEIVTKVVGTSFRIRAFDDQPNIEVFVKTGQVNVRNIKPYGKVSPQEIALLPNESVSFSKKQNVFEKPLPRNVRGKGIESLSFEFTDTPVSTIFSTIEAAYGVDVDYPGEVLSECYLSTSLSDEPLPEKLKIICESLGPDSRYEMQGNRIIIKSNGCN